MVNQLWTRKRHRLVAPARGVWWHPFVHCPQLQFGIWWRRPWLSWLWNGVYEVTWTLNQVFTWLIGEIEAHFMDRASISWDGIGPDRGMVLWLWWPQETKKDAIVKRVSPGGWCDIPSLWKPLDAGHNMLEVWACCGCLRIWPSFRSSCFFCFLAFRVGRTYCTCWIKWLDTSFWIVNLACLAKTIGLDDISILMDGPDGHQSKYLRVSYTQGVWIPMALMTTAFSFW